MNENFDRNRSRDILVRLRELGVNTPFIGSGSEAPVNDTDVQKAEKYLNDLSEFVLGFDFMRLGQAIHHGRWQTAAMILQRMTGKSKELGIDGFQSLFMGLRLSVNGRNAGEAQQLLAKVVAKRVQLMEVMR